MPALRVAVTAWPALTASFGERATSASLLQEILPAPHVLVLGTPMVGGALTMVLGAIVAGNGYGWGTWKTVLMQGPSPLSATGAQATAVLAAHVVVLPATALVVVHRRDVA